MLSPHEWVEGPPPFEDDYGENMFPLPLGLSSKQKLNKASDVI